MRVSWKNASLLMRRRSLVAAVMLAGCASGWSARDDADRDWVHSRFPQALERLLPLDPSALLSCRVYRDYWVDTREYLISLPEGEDETSPVLVVVEPRGQSIWEQLWDAHRRHPERDLDEILSRVELRTRKFKVAECASLAALGTLDSKSVEVAPRPDSITIHPFVRQCLSSRGDVIVITEGSHVAAVWLDRARGALESCRPAG